MERRVRTVPSAAIRVARGDAALTRERCSLWDARVRDDHVCVRGVQVLGPFPWGMRELGGDLLEAYGGVDSLPFPTDDSFPSELADAGLIRGITVATEADNRTVGPITFPDIRCVSASRERGA